MAVIKKGLIICSKHSINFNNIESFYIIGVDKGCTNVIEKKWPLNLAVGDFDHVTSLEYQLIKKNAKLIVELPRDKDHIDGEIAVQKAIKMNLSPIYLIAQGKRIDMDLASLSLVNKYGIIWLTDDSRIEKLHQGWNKITKDEDYKYVSIFSLESTSITIKNMKYETKNLHLEPLSINAISNEIIDDQNGEVYVKNNNALIIFSK